MFRLAKSFEKLSIIFPPPHLCTDNAAMVAWASMHRFAAGDHDPYEIDTRPRWSIEDLEIGETLDEHDAMPAGGKAIDPSIFERSQLTSRKNKFNTSSWHVDSA